MFSSFYQGKTLIVKGGIGSHKVYWRGNLDGYNTAPHNTLRVPRDPDGRGC
jgi:hypothetical protein